MPYVRFAFAVLLLMLPVSQAEASTHAGRIDRSFGTHGKVVLDGEASREASYPGEAVGLPDGSSFWIEQVGTRYALVKYDADGSPAEEFGNHGTLLMPYFGRHRYSLWDVALQGDSIVTLSAGEHEQVGKTIVQRRDLETGALDSAFGSSGSARFDFSKYLGKYTRDPYPFEFEVDSNYRIYVGSSTQDFDADRALIRLTVHGKLDTNFARKGLLIIPKGPCPRSTDDLEFTELGIYAFYERCVRRWNYGGVQDGSFEAEYPFGNIRGIVDAPGDRIYVDMGDDFGSIRTLLRLDGDGRPDPTFGTDGHVSLPVFEEWNLGNMTLDTAGRIYFSGTADNDDKDGSGNSDTELEMLRLTADGAPDPAFGGDGLVVFDAPEDLYGHMPFTLVGDGLIMVRYRYGVRGLPAMKVLENGDEDPGFGAGGRIHFYALMPPDDHVFDTLAPEGGGILAAAQTGRSATIVKYRRNGGLDRSFGAGGRLTLPAGTTRIRDAALKLAQSADGDFVGCVRVNQGIEVVRFRPDGTLETGFGDEGRAQLPQITNCAGIAAVGDRILVAGNFGEQGYLVLRLGPDGSWDRSYGEDGWGFGLTQGYRAGKFAFAALPGGGVLLANRGEISRLLPNGMLDRRFGGDGIAELPGGLRDAPMIDADAVLTTRKGFAYVVGHGSSHPVIVKVGPKGKPVWTYGKRGVRTVGEPGYRTRSVDARLQRDGKLLFAATVQSFECRQGCGSIRVVRLGPGGRLDRSFGQRGVTRFRAGFRATAASISVARRRIIVGGTVETSSGRDDLLIAGFHR